jgi:FkbM family methyltransferase
VARGKSNLNTISVEMNTLDELLITNRCPIDFDVLVIDTEGSESEVLK